MIRARFRLVYAWQKSIHSTRLFPFSLSTRSSTSSDDRVVAAGAGIVKNGYRGFGLFMELSIFGPRFAEDWFI